MAKTREIYICSTCGNQSLVWQGQCPACKEWNTLAAEVVSKKSPSESKSGGKNAPVALEEVGGELMQGRPTGFEELDRVLGKGLTPGAAVLLGGEPGIGKSTLLLQLAGSVATRGGRAVYASGEESLPQLKGRAERLGLLGPGLLAMATANNDDLLSLFTSGQPPELLIVDSVQTMASSRVDGIPGSVSQVRAVSTELIEQAKKSATTLFLVGHVTKEGSIAGPKLMEHMVDTVLYLEGDRRHLYRILRVLKNRFGPSDELLVLEMLEKGLSIVSDPSTFFLGERDASLSGTAVVMAMDGQRPFAVEVQALVGRSTLSFPRRTALGFDVNRLHLLLAVLEKHLRINLATSDVYCKIGGGLKLAEPGLDLGIVAAVLSSLYDRPLPEGAVFWGEIDLNGMVRPVSAHDIRRKQAKRLGYGPMFFSRQGKGLHGSGTIGGFQKALFGQESGQGEG
jgi:DNA repair protein RadA/Sms